MVSNGEEYFVPDIVLNIQAANFQKVPSFLIGWQQPPSWSPFINNIHFFFHYYFQCFFHSFSDLLPFNTHCALFKLISCSLSPHPVLYQVECRYPGDRALQNHRAPGSNADVTSLCQRQTSFFINNFSQNLTCRIE